LIDTHPDVHVTFAALPRTPSIMLRLLHKIMLTVRISTNELRIIRTAVFRQISDLPDCFDVI
jgi:hypothetical protein